MQLQLQSFIRLMSEPILLSTALFPPIDYMALLLFHPEVYIEAHENYQKQSYRNRYYILGPNGVQLLQVPVLKGTTPHIPVREVMTGGPLPWQRIHLRSIETAFSNSPWYLHYSEQVESLLTHSSRSLWEFNHQVLSGLVEMLGMEVAWKHTRGYEHQLPGSIDLREAIHPRHWLSGKSIIPYTETYQQVFMEKHGFVPHLSILDLLFNEGPASKGLLLRRYTMLINTLGQIEK